MKSNPIAKVEKKVANALKEAVSRGGLSSAQRKSLVNNCSTPPQLSTYRLAKHLASILLPPMSETPGTLSQSWK